MVHVCFINEMILLLSLFSTGGFTGLPGEKHKRSISALTKYIKIITKEGHSDPGQRKGS